MQESEFERYVKKYEKCVAQVRHPQLFVYLRASRATLLQRIKKRNREFEQSMDEEYLDTLTSFYDKFFEKIEKGDGIAKTRVVVIDTDGRDAKNVYEMVMRVLNK